MYFKSFNWTIRQIVARATTIDPKPQYQRGPVWTTPKRQLLIDSVINRFDIPKIYLRYRKGGIFDYEVADGQQRLRAIWDFFAGVYPLGSVIAPNKRYGGKFFEELSGAERDHLRDYKLTITVVYEATGEQIRELFARLQKGERLTPAELRNSMPSALGDVIRAMAQTHAFFVKSPFSSSRYKHDNLIAHAFALELYSGSRDIKAPDLAEMYSEYKGSISDASVRRVNNALTYLSKIQRAGRNCIRTKWGFVDLFWLALKHRSDLPTPDVMASRYTSFEQERLLYVSDPSVLIAPRRTAADRDLYKYIVAFASSGAVKENLAARQAVLLKRLM